MHDLGRFVGRLLDVYDRDNMSREDYQLMNQLIDDSRKLMKFAPRYKPENLEVKINALGDVIDDFIARMNVPENKTGNEKLEQKSNVVNAVKNEKMNNAPKNQDAGQMTMSLRGGKREGAGRKPAMENPVVRKVSITLPKEKWDEIDQMIEVADIKSLSNYFRLMVAPEIKVESR